MSLAVDILQVSSRAVLLATGFLADAPLALRSGLFATSHAIPGPADHVATVLETIRTAKGEWKQPLMFTTTFMCITLILATLVAIAFAMLEKHTLSTLFTPDEFSTPAIMPILITCAFFSGILMAYSKKHANTSPAWMTRASTLMCDVVLLVPLVGMGLSAGRKIIDPSRGTHTLNENLGSLMAGTGVFAATFMAGMAIL